MPILLYAVCIRQEIRTVAGLTINRFFVKLFRTSSVVTVRECLDILTLFGVDRPSVVLAEI